MGDAVQVPRAELGEGIIPLSKCVAGPVSLCGTGADAIGAPRAGVSAGHADPQQLYLLKDHGGQVVFSRKG